MEFIDLKIVLPVRLSDPSTQIVPNFDGTGILKPSYPTQLPLNHGSVLP